jgi:prepilin-type N-terminal cleavage/methylation domain-containing protein
MMKFSCDVKGFTLVELLSATAILAVVLMGLIQMFVRCSFLSELAKNKTIAASIAQSKLEEIRDTDYEDIVSTHAPRCPCFDGLNNDGDAAADYPADTGCSSAQDTREDYECADGLDNDGNGLIDLADSGCASATDDDEGYLPSVTYGSCAGTFTVTESEYKLLSASGAVSIDAGNANIMEVQVVVNWTNKGGRTSSMTVKSIISKK